MLDFQVSRSRWTLRGAVALAAAASFIPLANPSLAANNIDNSQAYYSSANIGSFNNVFDGGTLRIVTSSTITQNFSVEDVSGNTIDVYGNTATMSGVLSGNGGLTFADSIGGGRNHPPPPQH